MDMTPMDIRQQRFKVRFRGFDVREVDAFLEQVAEALEAIVRENAELRERVRRLSTEIKENKDREEGFKRAILQSQKILESMKANAQQEAKLIVREAEQKAESILHTAHSRLAQIHEDISEMKRQRIQLEVQIRSVLEAHRKLLDLSQEEMAAIGEDDEKIAFLKKA